MLHQVGALGLVEETTPGTAETITVSHIVFAEEPTIEINPNMVEQAVLRDVALAKAPIRGGRNCSVNFTIHMEGSGTAATAPVGLGDALESCGLVETVVAATRVSYSPEPTLDKDTIKSITAKLFKDGKYRTAAGVRGNAVFTLTPGGTCKMAYTGQGAYEADGDTAVLAEPTDSRIPPLVKGAEVLLLEHLSTVYDGSDGVDELLRDGAASNLELSQTIEQNTSARKVRRIRLLCKKVGAPAAETDGVWVEIQGDSGGDPDGTPITNGTSASVATTAIPTTDTWIDFDFTEGSEPELDADTTYHMVVTGDYTAAADACISISTEVVTAGNQICQYFDAAWAALAEKNLSCQILFGEAVIFGESTLDLGNNIILEQDPSASEGWRSAIITAMKPTISVEPIEELSATRDFYSYLNNATDMFFTATVGDTSGNRYTFTAAHCVAVSGGTWGDRDGEVSSPMNLQVEHPEWLTITFD